MGGLNVEIAKNNLKIKYETSKKGQAKRAKKGFLENYGFFTAITVFTLTFSLINIILIMSFLRTIANF